ncbi:porin [Trinickia terrae]|uniref:Porin n=1 Tax=Trinickia terrae TaxID=2571161 RepID=A0A4U1HTF2_9BURK|nr:porin [Trinickia terrae]TKC82944.1 porin [Trinickia terrae]
MKKQRRIQALLLAGASLGAASAHAQSSVTLYGVVDDAIAYANNQKGASNVYLAQGNLYASKFGFRGTEDLGGGTSAIFDLQAGFNANTGAASAAGLIFNRQSYVGLQNQTYGTVTMGRQYTPYLLFVGPLASSSWTTGATGAHPGDYDGLDTTIRINNSVTYTSPTYYGLSASAMYAFSGIAGSPGKGQTYSGALRYASGPVSLAAGYLRIDNTGLTSGFDANATGSFAVSPVNQGYQSARALQNVAAAGNYTLGNLTLGLNYTNVEYLAGGKSLFANTAVFNTYGAIAAYRFTPALDIAGAFAYTLAAKSNGISSAARYQQYSLRESYHLSKRTTLYALQAFQHASGQTLGAKGAGNIVDAVAVVGDSQNSTPSSTNKQFVGMAGITVTF